MEDFGIHILWPLVCLMVICFFVAIWYILWSFSIFSPVLVLCTKNNLGEPLWLSGKVVKMRKLMKSRGPGFAPDPGQPFF
jgi:hypothetical protein